MSCFHKLMNAIKRHVHFKSFGYVDEFDLIYVISIHRFYTLMINHYLMINKENLVNI